MSMIDKLHIGMNINFMRITYDLKKQLYSYELRDEILI